MPVLALTWDYPQPMPASNIVFEIWQSHDMARWSLLSVVVKPPIYLGGSGTMFFTVHSVDVTTGLRGE